MMIIMVVVAMKSWTREEEGRKEQEQEKRNHQHLHPSFSTVSAGMRGGGADEAMTTTSGCLFLFLPCCQCSGRFRLPHPGKRWSQNSNKSARRLLFNGVHGNERRRGRRGIRRGRGKMTASALRRGRHGGRRGRKKRGRGKGSGRGG